METTDLKKTDIHCHLEACFRHQTLIEIGERVGLPVPRDVQTFRDQYLVAEQQENLAAMIAGFARVQALWFDTPAITRLTREAVEDAATQGVRLLELRYAPDFIQNGRAISFDEIHRAILDGIAEANADIAVGLIGIVRRTLPLADAASVVDFIVANNDTFVGMDLADQEVNYPGGEFAALFRHASAKGLGITIHAGEVSVEESRVNVRDAIVKMGATRIGHGLHIISDPALIDLVIDHDVTLELCPTSNVLTGSVPDLASHPFRRLMEAGVRTTINTDDPSLFGINWQSEYQTAVNAFGLSEAELDRCISNARAASFVPESDVNAAFQL